MYVTKTVCSHRPQMTLLFTIKKIRHIMSIVDLATITKLQLHRETFLEATSICLLTLISVCFNYIVKNDSF